MEEQKKGNKFAKLRQYAEAQKAAENTTPIASRKTPTAQQPLVEGPAISGTLKEKPLAAPVNVHGKKKPEPKARAGVAGSPSKYKKAMKIVKWASLGLGIAAIGLGAYAIIDSRIAKKDRAEKIERMAVEIKRCSVKPPEGCMKKEERMRLERAAKKAKEKAEEISERIDHYMQTCSQSTEGFRCKNSDIITFFGSAGSNGLAIAAKEISDVLESESKRCGGKEDLQKGCMTPQEIMRLKSAAESSEKAGKYKKAGLRYVEVLAHISPEEKTEASAIRNKIEEMIKNCRNGNDVKGVITNQDLSGAIEIEQALENFSDALEMSTK